MSTSLIAKSCYVHLLTDDDTGRPTTKARLRLQAAISMLHMCSVEKYANALKHGFVNLAIMIQVLDIHFYQNIVDRPGANIV